MAQFLDIFSFLSVLFRGLTLALQSLVIGGIAFLLLALRTAPDAPAEALAATWAAARRLLFWSAIALAFIVAAYVFSDGAVLVASTELDWTTVAGASFARAGALSFAGAVLAAAIARSRSRFAAPLHFLACLTILSGSVLTSHAAARLDDRGFAILLTAIHQLACATWIGGLPYLWIASRRIPDAAAARTVSSRFSRLAQASVAALIAAGALMAVLYTGSWQALYGTSYGAMVLIKVALLAVLLLLGALNFRLVARMRSGDASALGFLRRFAEAEIGIGFTVILAAASLTSQPPAADLPGQWATVPQIVERIAPRWPSFRTPPVQALTPVPASPDAFLPVSSAPSRTEDDIAWSEYNHHWSGLVVLSIGLLAVLAGTGRARWARHWPLLFLGLAAFLLIRADAENWPLGPRGFWASFTVAEVAQHRLFVLLIVIFAVFEWSVRNGRLRAAWPAFIFPAVCAAGGALLLTHSHALNDLREEFLIELSHLPLAFFAVLAGWSRWLELRLPSPPRLIAARIWPPCFVAIGVILLLYREA